MTLPTPRRTPRHVFWLTAVMLVLGQWAVVPVAYAAETLKELEAQYDAAFAAKDFERADALAIEGLAQAKTTGGPDDREIARWFARIALVAVRRGEYGFARVMYNDGQEALRKAAPPDDPEFMVFRHRIADLTWADGAADRALAYGRDWLAEARTLHGLRSAFTADAHTWIGMVARSEEQFGLAITHLEMAAKLYAALGQARARDAIRARHMLGDVFRSQGRYQDALTTLQQAERLAADTEPDGYVAGDIHLALGDLLAQMDRLGEAETHLRKALVLQRKHAGPTHMAVASVLGSLETVLSATDRLDEALELNEQRIAMVAAVYGPDSPEALQARTTRARITLQRGRLDEAEAIYTRILATLEKARGPNDASLIDPLGGLADVHAQRGDRSTSERLTQRVITITRGYRSVDPTALGVQHLIYAQRLTYWRRFGDAEKQVRSALEIFRDTLGPAHRLTVQAMSVLAAIYTAQGRTEERAALNARIAIVSDGKAPASATGKMEQLAHRALGAATANRDDEALTAFKAWLNLAEAGQSVAPIALVTGYANFGAFHLSRGRPEKARPLLDKAVALVRRYNLYGTQGRMALFMRARMHANVGELDRAYPIMDELFKRLEKIPDRDMMEWAALVQLHGIISARLGRFAEAERFIQAGLHDVRIRFSSHHPARRVALTTTRDFYDAWGRQDAVKFYQSQIDNLPQPGTRHLPLFYATNRGIAPVAAPKTPHDVAFNSRSTDQLTIGRATMLVPADEIARRAQRNAQAMGLLHDAQGRLASVDRLKLLAVYKAPAQQAFTTELRIMAHRAVRFKGQALIFVHGYNVAFENAMIRATQITFDLDFDGPVLPFAWPSQGSLLGYRTDQQSAADASARLVEFIDFLSTQAGELKLHIVAHSMGNRVLAGALEMIAQRGGIRGRDGQIGSGKLGEVILAHPDLAQKRAAKMVANAAAHVAGFTLYTSDEDKALVVSSVVNWSDRAGLGGTPIKGVDVIDVSGMEDLEAPGWFGLKHATFVRNPVLFGDLTKLLLTSARPPHLRSLGAFDRAPGREGVWRYSGGSVAPGAAERTKIQIAARGEDAARALLTEQTLPQVATRAGAAAPVRGLTAAAKQTGPPGAETTQTRGAKAARGAKPAPLRPRDQNAPEAASTPRVAQAPVASRAATSVARAPQSRTAPAVLARTNATPTPAAHEADRQTARRITARPVSTSPATLVSANRATTPRAVRPAPARMAPEPRKRGVVRPAATDRAEISPMKSAALQPASLPSPSQPAKSDVTTGAAPRLTPSAAPQRAPAERASTPAVPIVQPETATDTAASDAGVLRAQQQLAALGFDPGPLDGVAGPQTRAAAAAYREALANGRGVPGTVDLSALGSDENATGGRPTRRRAYATCGLYQYRAGDRCVDARYGAQ